MHTANSHLLPTSQQRHSVDVQKTQPTLQETSVWNPAVNTCWNSQRFCPVEAKQCRLVLLWTDTTFSRQKMNQTCKHNFKGNKKLNLRPFGMTDALTKWLRITTKGRWKNASTKSKFATKAKQNILRAGLDLNRKHFHKCQHYSLRETLSS